MALTDPLTVAEFYSQDVWGTPFGGSHRGFDIERAASRPVPHLFPGTVVRRSRNSELGGFVVADRGAGVRGRYIGYGHTVGGAGNSLGHVADYAEDHGSKWSAPHTHVTVSDSMYGIDTPGVAVYDPEPFIAAALTAAAGGGSIPFPSTPQRKAASAMTLFHKMSTTEKGPTLYALAGDSPGIPDANWIETTAQDFANELSTQAGGPSAGVNDATWAQLKAWYRSPLAIAGGSGGSAAALPDPAAYGKIVGQSIVAELAQVGFAAEGGFGVKK